MRTILSIAVLLGLLAGCSADQPSGDGKSDKAAGPLSALGTGVEMEQIIGTRREIAHSFASMPDRGELVAYDSARTVKRSGAYTAYPVSLSEEHALNAMRTGEITIRAPNGELIRLAYERLVEHEDGNWSWIGRNADGADAVITFGEKAVFGSIPQGSSEVLRLVTSAGRSFLVTADRAKLAGTTALRRSGTDQMIPPRVREAAGADQFVSSSAVQAAATQTAAAGASSVPIDLLLGYTQGYVAAAGGASQAVTRLVNLVDVTNQAYSNSGVLRRLRLVGTLQVAYPDDTDNGETLEKLTGYRSGTDGGAVTPDAAFAALRTMRDEKGADLVSLVRSFRTPQNNGCGIAWLLGADQSGIQAADAPFGYSIISDGTDIDEGDGNTYFCRDETLAHELGHNMGQAHNPEDSDSAGANGYSYGYRETSSSGFYTVMAYPRTDGSQFSIRYFGNPAISYLGRPTGVANQADNAASLNQWMPVVASFRETAIPLAVKRSKDANGDGTDDLFWQNPAQGLEQTWLMNGTTWTYSQVNAVSGIYEVAAIGDFNGDGRADIIWTDTAKTAVFEWQAQPGGGYRIQYLRNYPAGWSVIGARDANGDGRDDLFWHNSSQGAQQTWFMNGLTWAYGPLNSIPNIYRAAAIGDFDGNGLADIIWFDQNKTSVWQWQARTDGTYNIALVGSYPVGWTVVGAQDANGDGTDDLFWHNQSRGVQQNWLMSGVAFRYGAAKAVPSIYQVSTVGDFNADGLADIVWQDQAKTSVWEWQGRSDGGYNVSYLRTYPAGWNIVNR